MMNTAWTEILNEAQAQQFMESVCFFHDSCLKEIKYFSGAYGEEKALYPINDTRSLRVLFQGHFDDNNHSLEMEFSGLEFLRLCPADEQHTCEILGAALLYQNGLFYWCDEWNLTLPQIEQYNGNIICAKNLRWRFVQAPFGPKEFFVPIT